MRDDRSLLPDAISRDATAMVSMPLRTSPTVLPRLSFMSFRACINWPVSSPEVASTSALRSPCATRRATRTAWFSGRVIERPIQIAKPMPAASASPPSPPSSNWLDCDCVSTATAKVLISADWLSTNLRILAKYASMAGVRRSVTIFCAVSSRSAFFSSNTASRAVRRTHGSSTFERHSL